MGSQQDALAVPEDGVLSASEQRRLAQLEAVVERGIDTFIEVALALVEIRDRRLYRATYPTFEGYVRARFQLAKRTAYGYIQAASVLANVPTSALSLSLLRELAPLSPEAQRQLALLIEGMTVAQARRTIREWRAGQRALIEAALRPAPPLPDGTFATVVADPPWSWAADFGDGLARDHYPSLSMEEIAALPVAELAAPDAHLYLWVPAAKLADGLQAVEAWGFTYRTELVWLKRGLGLGTWFRVGTESILFATRGSLRTSPNVPNWFEAPRGRHSQKPEDFFRLVQRASPGPYLELFARRARPGWTTWGNEIESERQHSAHAGA
jgi:N6-adenosine-specific RNA methylase IME4